MQKRLKLLIFLALGLMVSGAAYAADPVPGMLDQWKTITTNFGNAMVRYGAQLLFGLAGIQITINGLNALRKGSEFQELVFHTVWTLVTITFFYAILVFSPTWFPKIIDSWNQVGGEGTKTGPLDPGAIFAMGLDIVESIRSAVHAKAGVSMVDMMRSFFITFQVLFVELFILLAFLVLAGQLALAMLKGYMWLCLGPVLLGFSGLKYTQDVALNTLKSGISIGVTILTCYAIAGMAQASVGIFNSQIATFELDNWMGLWNCVGVAALIAMAAWNVPKIANDFINGSISGGLGETLATGAVAAGGAAALAGGMGGMMAGAGQSAVSNLQQVAQSGMDAGGGSVAGGGVGAIAQAAAGGGSAGGGITGGSINNMLDTSPSQTRAGGGNDALGGGSSRGADMSPAGGAGKGGDTSSSPAGGETADRNGGGASPGPQGGATGAAGNSPGSGDASEARLGGGSGSGSGNGPTNANDEIGKQLQQLAKMMGQQNEPSVGEQVRNLAGYVPNEPQSVGVNAQLGGGHE